MPAVYWKHVYSTGTGVVAGGDADELKALWHMHVMLGYGVNRGHQMALSAWCGGVLVDYNFEEL